MIAQFPVSETFHTGTSLSSHRINQHEHSRIQTTSTSLSHLTHSDIYIYIYILPYSPEYSTIFLLFIGIKSLLPG